MIGMATVAVHIKGIRQDRGVEMCFLTAVGQRGRMGRIITDATSDGSYFGGGEGLEVLLADDWLGVLPGSTHVRFPRSEKSEKSDTEPLVGFLLRLLVLLLLLRLSLLFLRPSRSLLRSSSRLR